MDEKKKKELLLFLADYVNANGGCNGSLRFTEMWAKENFGEKAEEIMEEIKSSGRTCDCEVAFYYCQ